MILFRNSAPLPSADEACPGRETAVETAERHAVTRRPLNGPIEPGHAIVSFGLGCFWGAERLFWQAGPGVEATAVGYQGGHTPNPTYEEVCAGITGHAEVVRIVFDPARIGFGALLKLFWESHDPTQGMRQGNDIGTQYRSAIYPTTAAQLQAASASRSAYQEALAASGRRFGPITTEIREAPPFYFAEDYHQQYLARNPRGTCGLAGTGVSCPAEIEVATA